MRLMWIKLHDKIVDSSIWQEPYHVRLVWITLLAKCNMSGLVEISAVRVAAAAHVSEDEAKEAIKVLMSPDPHSKSQDYEGRRIEKVEGGFRIINYHKYRDIKNPKDRVNYMRDYMKKYRDKKSSGGQLTWKEVYSHEANDAMTIPIPAHFPPEVESALQAFMQHRFDLATKSGRKQDSPRFTPAMVKSLLEETEIALVYSTPNKVADRLRNAASAGYRAPKFNGFYD